MNSIAVNLFLASAVIFATIAWMNNIDSIVRENAWRKVNERKCNVARLYVPPEGGERSTTVGLVQMVDIVTISM